MSMLLSPEERRRFAEWLRADAASDRALAEQAKKLGGFGAAYLAGGKLEDAAAKEHVAQLLEPLT